MKKLSYLIFFLISTINHLSAQQIEGYLIDPLNQDTLSEITVYNQTKNLSTSSDQKGYFQIMAQEGDTIHFLQKGFYPRQILIRSHHFWDHLYIHLSRHTILLNSEQLMQERWTQILKKFRRPMVIAGLPGGDKRKNIDTRTTITVISEANIKADIQEAYQLNDEQVEKLISMFYEQQNSILKNKEDHEIISFFLQYVEAKKQQYQ